MEKTTNNESTEQTYWGFDERTKEMMKAREPLDALYERLGASTVSAITGSKANYAGTDYRLTMANGQVLEVEEKIQLRGFKHSLEMLTEVDHWTKKTKAYRCPGWALKPSTAQLLVDFCAETGDFFIYDYQKWLAKYKQIINTPTNQLTDKQLVILAKLNTKPDLNCYVPVHARSSYYTTRNLIIDRSVFAGCLKVYGNISLDLKQVLYPYVTGIKNKNLRTVNVPKTKWIVKMEVAQGGSQS